MKEATFIVNKEWISPIYHYKELNDCTAKLWEEVFALFTKFEFIRDQHLFDINIEWDELKNVLSSHLKYSISLHEYARMDAKIKKEYWEYATQETHSAKLKCKVKTATKGLNAKIIHYLELFFYEIFLVMNLSGPGSCNFERTSIRDDTEKDLSQHLGLSAHLFARSWDIFHENQWPFIQYIPLKTSWNWYQSLNIGTKQLAETSMERALFALVSMAKTSNFDPSSVLWLAHILEALYGSPKKNIQQVLIERINMFLNSDKRNIKGKIKRFYTYRNRFIHGQLGTRNSINNSLFDNNKLPNYDNRLNDETNFSMTIVIATIQRLILNNCSEIELTDSANSL